MLERLKNFANMIWVIPISVLIICQPARPSDFRIVFISDRDGSQDVWIMDEDGSNLKNLTRGKKSKEEDPTVSPDGKQIAFVSDRGPNKQRWIFIMDANGRHQKNITEGSGEEFPVWSPDGTKIAYTGLAGNSLSIYIIDIANWDPEAGMPKEFNITGPPSTDMTPCWSPDGDKMAFSSNRQGNNLEIYTMDVDLVNPNPDNIVGLNRLTKDKKVDREPNWSPDGKKIAFSTNRDGNWEIYVMDTKGENLVNLTNDPAKDQSSCWSPDGKKIAFSTNRDGNWEIYVMDADGANPVNLTNNPAKDLQPVWLYEHEIKLPGQSVEPSGKLIMTWGDVKK
ncbi:MAG: DPP IV N-terminal domain-containing protein [Candidatus Poribacteria bacterium]